MFEASAVELLSTPKRSRVGNVIKFHKTSYRAIKNFMISYLRVDAYAELQAKKLVTHKKWRKIMKTWTKPAVREQEVGLEVTSYLPAEIDVI